MSLQNHPLIELAVVWLALALIVGPLTWWLLKNVLRNR